MCLLCQMECYQLQERDFEDSRKDIYLVSIFCLGGVEGG